MISRRTFLRRSLQLSSGCVGIAATGTAYGYWEASSIRIDRREVTLPHLPEPFVGKTIAVLADLHLGPYVGIRFIRHCVRLTQSLEADIIALVGDYGHRGDQALVQMVPCLEALSELTAPLGIFAVPGNHDMHDGGQTYHEAIRRTPLVDLTNTSAFVECEGERLWLAGVDDLWWGKPNLAQALERVPPKSAVVLLCHNPDYLEEQPDERVGLALCGHTHGGQVYLPMVGSPWTPTKYGEKYRHGLVQGPASQVLVSRGIGESGVPVRLCAPPEINLLTLRSS